MTATSGSRRSSSVRKAVAGAGSRFPVLLFSHGFGESGLTYATLLTELASRGYAVFAIEHPGDAYAVAYPDGRVVAFPQAAWDSALKSGGAVAFQLAQIPVRARALDSVLDRIVREARGARPSSIFARLDVSRVGAFGHSLGGMAAAELCRRDSRIRACMNQDAEYQGIPWLPGDSPRQAFAFLATNHSLYAGANSDPPPSDEALGREGLTRAGYDSLVQRRAAEQDSALASVPGGAVRVSLQSFDFSHRSFMDLRLLGAGSDSAARVHRRNLELARRYTLIFFDRTLRGLQSSALDESSSPAGVRIQRWPAH